MFAHIRGHLRRTVTTQVLLARAYYATDMSDWNRHDRRVAQMGNSYGHIHPFFNEVYDPIDEQDVCADLGISQQKVVQDGTEVASTKEDRCRH
jgi:hypothetical protein